jgi:tRNA (cytidine/uridine-2'-O-)-methyltransferase
MLKIALYQPEIAGNVGSIIRTAVCFDAELHIIEPCGFPFDMKRVRKSAMDYIDHAKIILHNSFEEFYQQVKAQNIRLVLASSKASKEYQDFDYDKNDMLLFGNESSGVPKKVADLCDEKIRIATSDNARCLNLAISCAIILSRAQIYAD